MKIIEAMKKVKANEAKVADLRNKIAKNCAYLSHETPLYGDKQAETVSGWLQAITDISRENVRLLVAIQRTNLTVSATIEIAGKPTTKTIAEWVWRRRTYAEADRMAWEALTDRGLKEGVVPSSTGGEATKISIARCYNPVVRDAKIEEYRTEPFEIDSALEVINATTELLEG